MTDTGAPAPQGGLPELRWLILQTAAGALPVETLIDRFGAVFEGMDRPAYRSKDEARLIWDVLWVLEFYSPNPSREPDPSEWNDAAAVLAVVRESARRLSQL
jgi:hypothetical protein